MLAHALHIFLHSLHAGFRTRCCCLMDAHLHMTA